jgi:hypothetical protein
MLNKEIDWTEIPVECPLCGDTGCRNAECDGFHGDEGLLGTGDTGPETD